MTVVVASPDFILRHTTGNNSVVSLYFLATIVLFFGIVFIAMYSYVSWKVIVRGKQFNERFYGSATAQTANVQALSRAARERTLVFTCVLAVMTYVGCTYSSTSIAIYVASKDPRTASSLMTFWIPGLLLTNSVLDPCVYFLKGYLENRSRKKATSGITLSKTSQSEQ